MTHGLVLEPEPSSVARARRHCEGCLLEWGQQELIDTVCLLVSELVTNVVLHAHTPCELRLQPGERLRVEVIDGSRRLPSRGLLRPEGSSGRGLLLVDALSADSGTVVEANGKRVWFEVEWTPVSPA